MFPHEYELRMKNSGIWFGAGESIFWKPIESSFNNENVLCERTKYFNYSPVGFHLDKGYLLTDIINRFQGGYDRIPDFFLELIENTKKLCEYDKGNANHLLKVSTNVIEAIKENYNNRGSLDHKHNFIFSVKCLIIKKKFVVFFIDGFARDSSLLGNSVTYSYDYQYIPHVNINSIRGKKLLGLKDKYIKPKKNVNAVTFPYNSSIEKHLKKYNMVYHDSAIIRQSEDEVIITLTFKR